MGVETLINNKPNEAYFDTGAEVSIISTKTAMENKFNIIPTNIKVKVADNSINEPVGETEALQVCLGDSVCFINFIVMHHDDHPILLGLDWFGCSGASLNPSANTVTFPRKTIYLNNTNIVNKEELNTIENDQPNEGRLDLLLDQDDNLDDFGIDPHQINEIIVESVTTIEKDELNEWHDVKESIIDRCSSGTHDIGKFNGDEMIIEVTSQIPVWRPSYRRAEKEQEEINELNDALFQAGIIEESVSPYNNPKK